MDTGTGWLGVVTLKLLNGLSHFLFFKYIFKWHRWISLQLSSSLRLLSIDHLRIHIPTSDCFRDSIILFSDRCNILIRSSINSASLQVFLSDHVGLLWYVGELLWVGLDCLRGCGILAAGLHGWEDQSLVMLSSFHKVYELSVFVLRVCLLVFVVW